MCERLSERERLGCLGPTLRDQLTRPPLSNRPITRPASLTCSRRRTTHAAFRTPSAPYRLQEHVDRSFRTNPTSPCSRNMADAMVSGSSVLCTRRSPPEAYRGSFRNLPNISRRFCDSRARETRPEGSPAPHAG